MNLASTSAPYLVLAVVLTVIGILVAVTISIRRAPYLAEPEEWVDSDSGPGDVDPWEYQRTLMAVSDQALPGLPTVSKGSMLYFALMLEETAETAVPLQAALRRVLGSNGRDAHGVLLPADQAARIEAAEATYLGKLESVRSRMHEASLMMRGALNDLPDFAATLTRAEAIELLDGTTDVQVVNSGFALASGLPAQEGYAEVVSSNLSKVDPAARKILKTMDGKWIKGPRYQAPDLERVLQQHLDSRARAIKREMEREDQRQERALAESAGRV